MSSSELEKKNNIVLANLDRFKKHFPNIEQLALALQEKLEIEKVMSDIVTIV